MLKPFLKFISHFACLLLPLISNAQDSIVFLNKNVVLAIVKEVNVNSIRYNKFENPDGPVYVTNKNEINYIRYKGGAIDKIDSLLKHSGTPVVTEAPGSNSTGGLDMYAKGCRDAKIHYTHGGGSTCIGFTGCAIGIVGVIPAAIVAYTPPAEKNLAYPNKSDWNNPEYKKGYMYTAHKMKRKKVWIGYGTGLAVAIVTVLVVNSIQ